MKCRMGFVSNSSSASYLSVYFYHVSELFKSEDMELLLKLTHENEVEFMKGVNSDYDEYGIDVIELEKFPERYQFHKFEDYHYEFLNKIHLLTKFREYRKKDAFAVFYSWENQWGDEPYSYESPGAIKDLNKLEECYVYERGT